MTALLTLREASGRLGLSVKSLQRLVDAGKIAVYRIGPKGGYTRFAEKDLEDYLARCRKVGGKR